MTKVEAASHWKRPLLFVWFKERRKSKSRSYQKITSHSKCVRAGFSLNINHQNACSLFLLLSYLLLFLSVFISKGERMHWIYLVLAITGEVAGTTCMKLSQGFTKPLPSIGIFVFYVACFTFLTLSLKKLDLSLSYAIWAGLGTALTTAIGITIFHEPVSVMKIGGVILIIGGVVVLNLGSGH